MIARADVGKPAQITFTSDFHELLEGDLRCGAPVTLRYDPRRIVPEDDPYVFGSPQYPVNAFVRFHEGEAVERAILTSPAGIVAQPTYDISGQGSMLVATIDVPGDAEEVVIWFSYLAASGEMHFDNDGGTCYCFRFPSAHVQVTEGTVVSNAAKGTGEFSLSVATSDVVEAVSVRYRIAGNAKFGHHEVSLHKNAEKNKEQKTTWSGTGIAVPPQSTVQFKIFFWIGQTRYKDDNSSRYYLAPEPAAEEVPPPPEELAAAAMAWKL